MPSNHPAAIVRRHMQRALEELPEMYADASSIARDLGYTTAVDLRDGLRRTIAAYRAHALSGEPDAQRAAP